jgi:hypothetical protein
MCCVCLSNYDEKDILYCKECLQSSYICTPCYKQLIKNKCIICHSKNYYKKNENENKNKTQSENETQAGNGNENHKLLFIINLLKNNKLILYKIFIFNCLLFTFFTFYYYIICYKLKKSYDRIIISLMSSLCCILVYNVCTVY